MADKLNRITAECDYIQGHLRSGYFKLLLTDEELVEFKTLSKKEQLSWIRSEGDLKITDYDIDDSSISDFEIN